MIGMPGRIAAVAAAGAAVAALAACSSGGPASVVTVTATAPISTTTVTPSAASPATAPASSTSSAPTAMTSLPGTCDTLLPDQAIFDALKLRGLPGRDAFVVGTPEPDIGRLAYINCRYGVTGTGAAATPAIEIGVSLYATPAKASARIPATVADYEAHGATSSAVTVKGLPATLLTGGAGAGYDVPLLVVASGQRTVAVSIAASLATGSKASSDAISLASLALDSTAS